MAMGFSEAAARQVCAELEQRGRGEGIRLVVETSECSGLTYRLEYVDVAEPADLVFDCHGARLFVDPKSLVYVDGTIISFSKDDYSSGFSIENPNEKDKCGCGESFYV